MTMKRKGVQNSPIKIYCTKREKLWKKCEIEGVFLKSKCVPKSCFLMKNWTSVTSDPSKKFSMRPKYILWVSKRLSKCSS